MPYIPLCIITKNHFEMCVSVERSTVPLCSWPFTGMQFSDNRWWERLLDEDRLYGDIYRFITRSHSCNSTVAISPCTTPYTTWYMSVYMAPLTSAAQLISAFQKKQVFYCYNGIFISSSTPLSAVTMTALIAFAKGIILYLLLIKVKKIWRAETS